MTREIFIERTLRQIYNTWLEDAIAVAAKTNYGDNLKLEGVAYVNGGFYTTFKGLTIQADEFFVWKSELPHIPVGLGSNEGINTIQIKENSTNISRPIILINQSQKSFYQEMRQIPNKVYGYLEGKFFYFISTILLSQYTVSVSMISGGDSTNLSSELNVPSDYFPMMVEYIKTQLMFERGVPVDNVNDGVDSLKTV